MTPAGVCVCVCVPLLCIVCPSESMLDGRVYRRGGMEEPMLLFLLAGVAVSSGFFFFFSFLQIGMQPASLHLGQSLRWMGRVRAAGHTPARTCG